MDPEATLLAAINAQLQEAIIELKRTQLEESRPSLQQLFTMGCGFTEFLTSVFQHLPLDQVLTCREVCTTWKDFIDIEVFERHPDVRMYHRWTQGMEEHGLVYCGGEVATMTSDNTRVYVALRRGEVLVFEGNSFTLEAILEGRAETVWQLQAGVHIVAAVTESCLTVWRKPKVPGPQGWVVVARVRHRSQGEPFLHTQRDLVAVPGDSKHVCRLMMYNEQKNTMAGLRDFEHGRHWVLGAHLELPRLLTLCLLAYGSGTERELRLWSVTDGRCLTSIVLPGGVTGFPALRFPHAFLSTAGKGLEVWNLQDSTKVRTVPGPVLGYQVQGQLVFLLTSHSKARIHRLREVTGGQEDLWAREVSWPVEGPVTGSLPRIQVDHERLLAVASTGRARDLLHVVSLHS